MKLVFHLFICLLPKEKKKFNCFQICVLEFVFHFFLNSCWEKKCNVFRFYNSILSMIIITSSAALICSISITFFSVAFKQNHHNHNNNFVKKKLQTKKPIFLFTIIPRNNNDGEQIFIQISCNLLLIKVFFFEFIFSCGLVWFGWLFGYIIIIIMMMLMIGKTKGKNSGISFNRIIFNQIVVNFFFYLKNFV